jgi:long-chain acyl-CoA synthetase
LPSGISFMDKRLTYGELGRLTDRAANGLQKLGVGPGVHVGLFLPNSPHYLVAFFGALKAGGTVVNYSPLDAAKVLEHKIEDSRTDILITLDMASLYPQMAAMLGKTRLKKLVVGIQTRQNTACARSNIAGQAGRRSRLRSRSNSRRSPAAA